jgi:hypothetical protein
MTNYKVYNNVETDFDITIPSEFQIHDGHACKIKLLNTFAVGTGNPAITIFAYPEIDLTSTITATSVPTFCSITGTFNYDVGSTNCWGQGVQILNSSGQVIDEETEFYTSPSSYRIFRGSQHQNFRVWMPFIIGTDGDVVPSGTRVISAIITVTGHPDGHVNGLMESKIGCDKRGDATIVPTSYTDLKNRQFTSAVEEITNTNWSVDTEYTFDVTRSVQEIINRSDWVNKNTLALMITSPSIHQNECMKSAYTYSGGAKKPVLTITF